MKKMIQALIAVVMLASMTGCATTKGYFVDRGRDAADMLTLTVGKGAGAKVRVGPLHAGVFGNTDCAGLRSGVLFATLGGHHGMFSSADPCELDLTVLLVEETGLQLPGKTQARGKTYEAGSLIPFLAALTDKGPLYMHWYYYTQVEAAMGLVGTVRMGVNAGEILDFLLGWFGVDIMHDDINRKDALPHGFAMGGQVIPRISSGWQVCMLVGCYADHAEWLSAILEAPKTFSQGMNFEGMNVKSEMTVTIDCTSNGNSVWGPDGPKEKNIIILPSGFHVYERRADDLIRPDFDVSRDDFRAFLAADLPEHSLVALKRFLETRTKETESNASSHLSGAASP